VNPAPALVKKIKFRKFHPVTMGLLPPAVPEKKPMTTHRGDSMRRLVVSVVAFLLTLGLGAQDLDMQAKFVKVLVSSTGQFGICCNNDPALKKTLE
jgi:hypothetical protein